MLDDGFTPPELFFVREHFPAPVISTPSWKLDAGGVIIPHAELVTMPGRALAATLECAENPAGGGMVSHAAWEGVPLAAVLQKMKPARFVRLTSFDGYSRTIPVEKASDPSTILAHRMNGESLPPAHGGPVRLLVPGWYGMDSVKWLRRIEFVDAPAEENEYTRRTRSLLAGVQPGDPVRAGLVKSVFSRPVEGAILRGRRFTVRGAAWAGESQVRGVEVSADEGRTWLPARVAAADRYCWAHWAFDWKIPGAGKHVLIARATGERGAVQPLERDSGRADEYEQNACQRVTVTAV